MIAAAIGAISHASSRNSGFTPSSSPPPKNSANWAMKLIEVPMPAAIDEIKMSRFATCESSWASTPRSSRSSRICRMPFVTATFAFVGLRPVAKAFGCTMSET